MIRSGRHPGTGAILPALDPDGQSGRAARKGKRPNVRGVARRDGRDLATLLQRSPVKGRGNAKIGKGRVGTSATTTIGASTGGHGKYLTKAQAEGIEHLDVQGLVETLIDEVTSEWIDKALRGAPAVPPRFGVIQGRDV